MRPKMFRNLDEIYAGLCDGMTYEERFVLKGFLTSEGDLGPIS